ncbi:hypothetical protein V1264_010000 [Littorina saxatilis]|uniref:Uncharacterized protein n=1 Tax=Littorina saxatilis TaxID=31220 RepID=A0AAN9G0B9_9CAEN
MVLLKPSPISVLVTAVSLMTTQSSAALLMRGSCQKSHKSVHFRVPGYLTSPIHTNECRETVSSSIAPVVSLNPGELLLFRRHYSTCCCAITETSLHETELQSADGRPPITLQYRRIEECVCVDCADLSTHRRVVLDTR